MKARTTKLIIITTLLVLLCGITGAYATAPTEAEMQAFQAARGKYQKQPVGLRHGANKNDKQ